MNRTRQLRSKSPSLSRPKRPRPLACSIGKALSVVAISSVVIAGFGSATAGAATYYWDADASVVGNDVDGANLGGTGTWDTVANRWWNLTSLVAWPNANTDTAVFAGAGGAVTLAPGITANALSFTTNGYVLAGGTLDLDGTAPGIEVELGETATINSQLTGNDGLIKTGGGTLRLGNTLNNYTGATVINNGTVSIASQSALGADTSAIVINGSATRGFGGGTLLLEGGYTSGVTLTRDLAMQGTGPTGASAVALLSVRNNTITGLLSNGPAVVNTAVSSASGRLTMSNVTVGGVAGTTFMTFGSANSGGVGSYAITGVLSGSGSIQKTGAGTLILSPSNASSFTGTIRIAAGSVRISAPTDLGNNAGTGTNSLLDMSGDNAILEVRSDSFTSTKNIYNRGGGSPILFVDHAIGGSAINGTASFGTLTFDDGETFNFNGRNGYGITIGAATAASNDGNATFANNLSGLLTFTGNFWSNSNTAAARTLTLSGNGDTLISGNIIATGGASFDHILTKSGSGTLTITSVGSTLDGAVNVQGGVVAITDFRSVTNNTSAINIGTSTTSAILNIGTATAATAAGLTTSKVINLAGSTGGATINANQAGANPVIFNANFTATGAGVKTLTLGGTNTADNIINGSIPNSSTADSTSVTKTNEGTWVLAGINSYTGSTNILQGTLKIKANAATSTIVADTNSTAAPTVVNLGFASNVQNSGGTLEFLGISGSPATETLGTLNAVTGSSTVKLTSGGAGAAANLIFAGLGTIANTTGVNFSTVGGGGGTVTFNSGATNTNGILNAHVYFNGADFAAVTAGVIGAATYTPISTGSMAAGNTSPYLVSGNLSQSTALINGGIKFGGNQTLTLNASQTLTINNSGVSTLATTAGGIVVSGATNAIITGGTGITTGGTGDLVIRVDGTTDQLTLSSVMTSGTSGGLTKNGAGTLVLTAANSQTGTTNINEGTVKLSGSGRLSASNVSLNLRTGATLDVNGVNSSTIATFNGGGTLTNGSGTAATVTVGNNNGTGTFSGLIQNGTGVLNITKTGSGAQVWSGLNTYTGVTTIASTGTVSIGLFGDIGTASGIGAGNSASNAASLVFTGVSTTQAYGGLIYTGDSVNTNRLFTFNGIANGGARIQNNGSNNAALNFTNTGALAFGTAATGIAQGLTLGGSSTADNLFNPLIANNGAALTSFYKVDAGLWILGNVANTYSGITRIDAGILRGISGTTLPTVSNLVLNGGVFETTGNFTRTIGSGSGQFQFQAPAADTAKFLGGLSAGTDKLTVNWGGGTPVWGSTSGFLDTRSGLILSSAVALSEIEITGNFSLGTASGAGSTPTVTTTSSSATVTFTTGTTAGLIVGQSIIGAGIPSGAYIVSINSTTGITISSNATVSATGVSATVPAANLRAIRVDDNTTTFTDFATITGAISSDAGTGIRKLGSGVLQMFGANTYDGETSVYQGTLVVDTLGKSGVNGASSVGATLNANDAAHAITLGNGGTGAGVLEYVGTGETSDRYIRLNTTTGSTQIHADGSGPLILTNVANDMVAGAKTLFLRGTNAQGNMITSVLADNGGTLGISLDAGGMWILTNAANSFSGILDLTAGALGVGNDTALGTSTIRVRNGSLFAYGGDRTLANAMAINSTTTAGTSTFIGDHNLTLNGNWDYQNTSAGHTFTNGISTDRTLTINGNMVFDDLTAGVTLAVNGSGNTVFNGSIATATTFNLGVTYSGTGSMTLSSTANSWNAGNLTVSNGTLRLGNNEVIPDGTGKGNVVLNPVAGATASFDLNGKTEMINGLTANTAGNVIINNSSASAASLVFGANNTAIDFGSGAGTYAITNSGAGALSITKTGSAAMLIPSGATLTYKGATAVTGGTMTIASAVNGTNALNVTNSGSTLALTGGITAPTLIKTVIVGDGGTLSLLDGTGNQLSALTSLTLGSTSGTNTTLNLNVGDQTAAGDELNTDTLTLLSGGALSLFAGNKITFNLTDIGLSASETYTLLSVAGGGLITGPLTAGSYVLGAAPGGFTSLILTATDTAVYITTGTLITGNLYWRGLTDTTWNGNANNWSTDKSGTPAAASIPGQGSDVIFQWNAPTNAAVTTTLEQNFKINSLTFEASTTPANTPTAVTIAPGTLATSRLEVAPQNATDGIKITAGGPAAVTISAALRLGANQTWNVADAASVLTLSGALFGEKDVTKTGDGKISLAGVADSTFNTGLTTDIIVNGGALEMTNVAALGTAANGNLANIIVNSGGGFFFNGAASTVANPITLGGGALSAAANTQTYSGPISVSAASTINMRDSNSATLTTTQRNITISGAISGAGKLTVDSINTVSSGNQLTGTLTLSGANTGWSGGLNLLRGTVAATNVNALGTGAITATGGKLLFNTAGGTTFNLAQPITIDAPSGVLELNADASGTPTSDMTVNITGAITLGSLTNGNMALRLIQATDNFSVFNIKGGIVLGDDASISVGTGSTTRVVTIDTVGISETGGARILTINDDLGGWGQTNQALAINVASTYTGGTNLAGGTLRLGHRNALGTGALTVTGASTLNPTIDLSASGAGTFLNELVLGNALTLTGTENLTFNAPITGSNADQSGSLINNLTAPAALLISSTSLNIGADNNTAARQFTIGGSSDTVVVNPLRNGNTFDNSFVKSGNGKLTFQSQNLYTGTTNIDQGTLVSLVDQTMTGGLNFGSTTSITTAGTLDLTSTSATFTSLTALTNSASATSMINIGAGESLNINGSVNLGSTATSLAVTQLAASGAGTLNVTNTALGSTFGLGNTGASRTIADFSGLANMVITLGTTDGIVRVGSTTGTNVAGGYSSLKLAQNTTITAKTLTVGAGGINNGAGVINTLVLGTATNIIKVDAVNIGTGTRDMGSIAFATATGTVNITAANGTGAATFNMGTGSATTGVVTDAVNSFDVRGHTATLNFAAVIIGAQNRGAEYSNYFGFDQGTLTMTSLAMATRTANSASGVGQTRITTSTMDLGGGMVTITNGILNLGQVSGNYDAATTNPAPVMNATVNVSGGSVTIGATSGTSINMGSYTATGGTGTGSSNGALNITGGTVSLAGNIVRVSAVSNSTATVTLDGGALNMNGKSIGTANAVTFNARSGTLSNVGQINGVSGGLNKTTGGTLRIEGTNTYGGATSVGAGKVVVSGSISGSAEVSPGAVLASGINTTVSKVFGNVTLLNDGTGGGTLAPGDTGDTIGSTTIGTMNIAGNLTMGDTGQVTHLTIEIGGAGNYDQIKLAPTSVVSLKSANLDLLVANSFNPTTLTLPTTNSSTGLANYDGSVLFIMSGSSNAITTNFFANAGAADAKLPGFGTFMLNGQLFAISYQANALTGEFFDDTGTPGTDVALMAVPEPNALAMLAGGLSVMAGLRRFRRRR